RLVLAQPFGDRLRAADQGGADAVAHQTDTGP
ncbi:MAG: hypothetical protein JWQ55_6654, partial [Rhodopila sp.]|nr:hypothetical protein [Rhodopila sp.]